jgi:hypothetical protein
MPTTNHVSKLPASSDNISSFGKLKADVASQFERLIGIFFGEIAVA